MELNHYLALAVRRISFVLGVLVLIASFGIQAKPTSAAMPAFVRVVHASPDIGTADVFLDGARLLSNFAFGTVTGYATIPPGPHKVQVALIGKGAGAAVIMQTLSVQPGLAYTVVGLGTKATSFSLAVFVENNQIATGKAKVRLYHLSPVTGAMNVSVNGSTVVSGLAYEQASNYLIVPPGSYTFDVTATQPNMTFPVSAALNANMVTSIFVVGLFNGTPQLQFVTAQVAGVPSLPSTGSDPHPTTAPGNSYLPALWLFGVLALLVVGAGVTTRYRSLANQKAKMLSRE
jgi:Domain of unknown function (DUF4397)